MGEHSTELWAVAERDVGVAGQWAEGKRSRGRDMAHVITERRESAESLTGLPRSNLARS